MCGPPRLCYINGASVADFERRTARPSERPPGSPAAVEAVARRWRDRLDGRAWVRTRDEAIDEGWFGPVSVEVRERYGDVVAAPTGDWAFMTRTFPQEMELVGMHASMTPAEMTVPLVVATGR